MYLHARRMRRDSGQRYVSWKEKVVHHNIGGNKELRRTQWDLESTQEWIGRHFPLRGTSSQDDSTREQVFQGECHGPRAGDLTGQASGQRIGQQCEPLLLEVGCRFDIGPGEHTGRASGPNVQEVAVWRRASETHNFGTSSIWRQNLIMDVHTKILHTQAVTDVAQQDGAIVSRDQGHFCYAVTPSIHSSISLHCQKGKRGTNHCFAQSFFRPVELKTHGQPCQHCFCIPWTVHTYSLYGSPRECPLDGCRAPAGINNVVVCTRTHAKVKSSTNTIYTLEKQMWSKYDDRNRVSLKRGSGGQSAHVYKKGSTHKNAHQP